MKPGMFYSMNAPENRRIVLPIIALAALLLLAAAVPAVSAQSASGTVSTAPADFCSLDVPVCSGDTAGTAPVSSLPANGTFCIYYFYGDGCPHCARIRPFIDGIAAKYPRAQLKSFEIYFNGTNQEMFRDFLSRYDVKTEGIPAVFISTKALVGEDIIRDNLGAAVHAAESGETVCPANYSVHAGIPQDISPVQKVDLTVPAVIAAALADSINPCAFAVLIFLLTYLVSLDDRRRVLLSGLVYISAVFLTYFASGLGLFAVIQQAGIAGIVATIAAVIAVIAGIINIADALRNRPVPLLSIPASRKDRIRAYVAEATLPAAFLLGILVSMVELPCTGGVYLAILGLLSTSMTPAAGLPYLVLYNLIFVAPLVLILVVVYAGVSADLLWHLQGSGRRWMRGAIGIFLVLLGVLMLTGIL